MAKARPSEDEYYLNIAREVASRATCIRRHFGALIVQNKQIISTGYAGAPRDTPNCCDLGKCYRQERKIPSGTHYELCRSVHAEMNAVIHAGRERTIGAKMYIYGIDLENNNKIIEGRPCLLCKRIIINAGITEVITQTETGEIKHYKVSDWIEELNKNPFADLDAILAADTQQ
ncbi:MAG: dCMP deaminase family protein [Candidatus Nanoarchaeia archaeon]